MNKTVYALAVGLFVVGPCVYAMENGAASVVKEVAAETAPEIIAPAATIVAPVATAVPTVCHLCPVKMACQKALSFCKRHPVCMAAGVAVAVAAIIYALVPAVQEKVQALFGVDSTKQTEAVEVETHAFPQEKIDTAEPA